MMLQSTHLSTNHVLLFCFKKKGRREAGWCSEELYLASAPNERSMNKKEGMLGQYLVCS